METYGIHAVVYLADSPCGNTDGALQPFLQVAADGDVTLDHGANQLAQPVVCPVGAVQIKHVPAMFSMNAARNTKKVRWNLRL